MADNVSVPSPKTRFLKVKCNGCGNEQVVFNAPATKVHCLACNKELILPAASKGIVKAKVLKVIE